MRRLHAVSRVHGLRDEHDDTIGAVIGTNRRWVWPLRGAESITVCLEFRLALMGDGTVAPPRREIVSH